MLKTLLLALLSLAVVPTYAGTVTGSLQGPSGIPIRNGTLNFVLNQAGLIIGTGAVVPTTASCYTDATGAVVGLPNMLTAPTAAANLGSGTLPGGIYFIFTTWINSTGGQSAPSPELRFQLASTGAIQISPPTSVPAGAVGIQVYAGTTSGGETLQGTQGLTNVFNFGALVSGASPPTSNNTVCQIAFNDTIIPFTGYTVSLISATGNAYPGYPQSWQLNGGLNGAVNISQGAPLWNGTVIYPMPILSQPLNRGPQSISGPLDFGGYNVTNVGSLTACSLNGVANVASICYASFADLGAKVNAAVAQCAQQCTVYVPNGNYSFSTQIAVPLNFFSQFSLVFDHGAVMVYSGSSDMILFQVAGAGPTNSNCSIQGGSFFGASSSAPSAVHIMATNTCKVSDMLISGFASGAGIWLDGTNSVNVIHNLLASNKVGVYMTNTWCSGTVCGPHPSFGSSFSANANHVTQNTIIGNTNWGIQLFDVDTNSNTGALNDTISENNLELNGNAGPTFGALSAGRSRGLIIEKNYFEGSPVIIQLGIPGGSDGSTRFFAAQGPVIRDNYFTIEDTLQTPPAGTYQINLLDTSNALIEGNSALSDTQSSLNCFINTLANNGTNIGETGTRIGKNSVQLTGGGAYTCIAGVGAQLVGAGSYIEMNPNYLSLIVNQAFQANTAVTSETIGVQNLTTSGSCQIFPIAGNSTGINNGRSTILAGTTYLSALTTNQVTITHPSGQAIFVDLYCTLSPQGGFGIP